LLKKLLDSIFVLICLVLLSPFTSYAENLEIIRGTLDVKVEEAREGIFITGARIIIIDANGNIVGNKLTNQKGEVSLPLTTFRNKIFPTENMGEVTVIVIADGYNEEIDFNVTINEFGQNKGRANAYLEKIREQGRNEPQYINGSYHRLTVFQMLDYYANKVGLKKQQLPKEIVGDPWSAKLKTN
jgi:hypothetical protein